MKREDIGSFEKINYSLRPGKNIERKMMFDVFSRLSAFKQLDNYRYVGFGSAYFSDFVLAHKSLGIHKLISIEKDDVDVNDRILFNQPFSCVKIHFGDSKNILPKLKWDEDYNIIWLDYDKRLNVDMLVDIDTFFSKSLPWSMFAITVKIDPYKKPESYKGTQKEFRLDQVNKNIGQSRIPNEYLNINLGNNEYQELVINIIDNEIVKTLGIRNGSVDPQKKLVYKQLFNFHYRDGATMLTVGGILYPESEHEIFSKMSFDTLPYMRTGVDSFRIEVPNLTIKEIRALDNLLPSKIDFNTGVIDMTDVNFTPFPVLKTEDIINYAKVYRFFPNFAELAQ
jgi:hypothetical protein